MNKTGGNDCMPCKQTTSTVCSHLLSLFFSHALVLFHKICDPLNLKDGKFLEILCSLVESKIKSTKIKHQAYAKGEKL